MREFLRILQRQATTNCQSTTCTSVCLSQPGDDYGYFELSDALGVRAMVTRFSLADIDAGRVKFVHRGTAQQQLRLQVGPAPIAQLY